MNGIAGFFGELKRRHVFRVALVYTAVGWLVLQVSNTLMPALQVPTWGQSLVAVLVILGFPIALVLAWAFDLTPHGVQRAAGWRSGSVGVVGPAPGAPEPEPPSAGPSVAIAEGTRRSVVVLPLADRSLGDGQQFLGDGITEELINSLARVEGLRIVSRTSAFAFRERGYDVREIGTKLGAGWVVEGSVRVSDQRLRITVQLVGVDDGYATWSGTFERRIEDLFRVEEEVARSIVETLALRLLETEGDESLPECGDAPLLQSSTADLEAYTLYLQGRALWNERKAASVREAIRYFERAIAVDPSYAHAHAGIADCYAILLDYGLLAPAAGLEPARTAVERALRFGDHLAESHTSAALVRQLEWDWRGAEAEFRRAIQLNPGYVVARQRYALFLAWMGRSFQGAEEIERARLLDPLSPVIAASTAWIRYYAGDAEEAVHRTRAALAQQPRFGPARIPLALALLQADRAQEAVRELEILHTIVGDTGPAVSLLAYALGRAGRDDEARTLRDQLRTRSRREHVPHYYLALPLLGLGEDAAALQELARAADARSPQLVYLNVEPIFAPLRDREEFRRILARLDFPPP